MRKMKNKIFAIPAAPAATPPNPKIAATNAMTKKTAAQYNIILSSLKNLFKIKDQLT
jgi:hypothetical protein